MPLGYYNKTGLPIFSKGHGKLYKVNGFLGKHHTKKTKDRISKSCKGKKRPPFSEEWKRKIGLANSIALKGKPKSWQKGEKNHCWNGGSSFFPYSINWTDDLKRAIRKRDKYTCQICGKEPSIICHHIDYDKKNCNPDNLITLCKKCHAKTNFNRNYWIDYFKSSFLNKS